MLDPFYLSAEQSARMMGMPDADIWAYIWTPAEVRRSREGTSQLCLKLRNLMIPEAIVLEIPSKELRVAAGHCIKMLGRCVTEDDPSFWAVGVPFNTGGYILIEPWLVEVPIGTQATALKRRLPDGSYQRWHEQLDPTWQTDGVRIADAMRVLDLKIRGVGRPRVGRDDRLDRLARAGLSWLSEHQYHVVEEVKISHLEEAINLNVKKLMEGRPGRPSVRIGDVHRRMREMLESEPR